MTIEPSIQLKKVRDQSSLNPSEYINELINELTFAYENIAAEINGNFRFSTAQNGTTRWVPEIFGSTTQGSATYTIQEGWTVRFGLMVEVFFDIEWSGHTGSGDSYISVPYKVSKPLTSSSGAPFVGSCSGDSINFGAGYSGLNLNAIPDTFQIQVIADGSSQPISNLSIPSSGRLKGSIRYIGQQYD